MNTVLMHGTKSDLQLQVIWIVHFLQSNSEILNEGSVPFFPPPFLLQNLRDLSSHHFLWFLLLLWNYQIAWAMRTMPNSSCAFSSPTSSSISAAAISPLYLYSLNFCCDIDHFCMKNCVDVFFTKAKFFPNLIKLMIH